MEPTLRPTLVSKQEAEEIDLQGRDIAKFVTRQQTLDREERAAWRDAQKQKLHVEKKKRADEIWMAEIEAEAEEKKRAVETEAEEKKRDDDIRIQMAKIEADKELALKHLERKAQEDQPAPALQRLHSHVIKMPSPQSYHRL